MPTKLSIVFCHGIWADGSSFSKVIPPLQAEGYEVMAAQYGLDSPEGDLATVKRTLGRVGNPAILVGHSYGGSVITAAGTDDRVVGSSTSRRLRTMQARHRRASRRSFRSQTCSSTSKSRTGVWADVCPRRWTRHWIAVGPLCRTRAPRALSEPHRGRRRVDISARRTGRPQVDARGGGIAAAECRQCRRRVPGVYSRLLASSATTISLPTRAFG